jgi:hypothetical protein
VASYCVADGNTLRQVDHVILIHPQIFLPLCISPVQSFLVVDRCLHFRHHHHRRHIQHILFDPFHPSIRLIDLFGVTLVPMNIVHLDMQSSNCFGMCSVSILLKRCLLLNLLLELCCLN